MIEIIQAEQHESGVYWHCWLEVSQEGESWMLPASAPGRLTAEELQAHFDAREAGLWRVAQVKRYTPDVFERLPLKRLLKAVALVMLDDGNRQTEKINELCRIAGIQELPGRTPNQVVSAIKEKLR